MAGTQPPTARYHAPVNNPNLPYVSSTQQDPSDSDAPPRSHVRDVSVSRGRVPASEHIPLPSIQTQQNGVALSPRSQSSAGSGRSPAGFNGGLERRPSATHSHFRQSSRAPGNHQLSRNAIFVTSPATSPLSPEISANVNIVPDFPSLTMIRRGASQRRPSESPSGTANNSIHSATANLAGDRELGDMSSEAVTQKRLDRTKSVKTRSGHNHHRSSSRSKQEQKSVGEYALHHLFNKFVVQADHKIDQCVVEVRESWHRVESICGAGADLEFDQLISTLAHINRQKPKPLVDTIMYWRKAKGDQATDAKRKVENVPSRSPNPIPRGLSRRTTELLPALYTETGQPVSGVDSSSDSALLSLEKQAILTEQRSAVSIYLLCRVLIEIYNQTDMVRLNPVLADKIEDIIFSQLKNVEPDHFLENPFRQANWRIFSHLLGVMSSTNLHSVTQHFSNALRLSQQELGIKSPFTSNLEGRTQILIIAMRHIHVRAQPDTLWKISCDFLHTVGEFFTNCHGGIVKDACCQTIEDLIMPIVANWNPQVNTTKWKDLLNMINLRVSQMIAKPRRWQQAFRLSTISLCASPTEHFAALWLSTATSLQAKLKDRATRACALESICRLVWTYLYRVTEPSSSVIRKLDDVMRVVLPSGKKTYLSTDPTFSEPVIELIRIIGYHHQDYCFRTIIFPLINSDLFTAGKETKVEHLEPERMVVGIRAFLAIITDLEKAERPAFPRFNGGGLAMDPHMVPVVSHTSQPAGGPKSAYAFDEDHLSRPVNTSIFGDTAKEYYARFCEILGKITLICDNTFGGQAVLDEKFGALTPKTPISDTFTFGRRDEHPGLVEHRQGFYELFHVAVQVLPRCLSAHIQLNSLINLLCTGTAHVESNIAVSATQSLKSIARHAFAQAVTMGFARFIFNFDARYSTMSDEGMLGPGHIENTLRLYVELLQIWIEEIKRKSKEATIGKLEDGSSGSRSLQLDLTSISVLVEEVESHGIFFLCSQSRRVRSYAVKVLRIVTELDTALGTDSPRIIQILEGDSQRVMDINDEQLTVAERSRLQKGKRKSTVHNTLTELCSSDVSYDATLWLKLFPNIIRLSFELCPIPVTLARDKICARLLQMHEIVSRLDTDARPLPAVGNDHGQSRVLNRLGATPPEIIIEQWKLYLVMACTTMMKSGAQTQSQLDKTQHARKISNKVQPGQDTIGSARSLFAYIIPLLSASQSSIRDAIVIALGSINLNLYRTLLESLQYAVTTCKEEAKQRIGTHQRTGSNPRRNRRTDRLRTEVTQVYRLTARFLHEPAVLQDEWILNNLTTYTKDLMIFLNDAEIQNDWECQKLRRQYCGLLEELFDGINRTPDPSRYMAFESRKSAFALMEDWCGYSPNQGQINQREDNMRLLALEQQTDTGEKTNVTAAMEIEKRNLRTAALSAMAALCAGPIRIQTDRGEKLSFDVRRMLSWIDQIFGTPNDKVHTIGRRALHNLLMYNRESPSLLELAVEKCYAAGRPRALESYFDVVAKVLTEHAEYPVTFWRILGAVLFTLGSQNCEIRIKSAKLLRTLEQRQQKNSKIQDFDISISDRTTAVYKLAQFEMSRRLARQYTELAFFIFSQFAVHFKNIHPDNQRNMVAAILPWIQVIELQVEPNGGPTAQSYMLLANLLEITTKASGALHNEIQALWQALATGPHGGNVQLVLDFVISLCLDRREQSFVDYAKQIIVFLSTTPAGQKVIEFLLQQINPRNMVQDKSEPTVLPPDNLGLPYVADLSEALPIGNKQSGLSLGQLSLIFLVDLMVSPIKLSQESVPLLLQVVLVLWDHYTLLVQEQAREMLVHLIHELVITKIDENTTIPNKNTIETFVESIRQHEPNVNWTYEEWNGKDEMDDSSRVPDSMTYVAAEVIDLFSLAYPSIQEQWAKTTLHWATSCPVRHIACRSFQIFRCILTSLDQPMLADILARLSNTIADEAHDVQMFAMEILTTLKIIIEALEPADLLQYPLLFWTTCACLHTIYEREFFATLGMLETLLAKVNLSDPAVVKLLEKARPPKWHATFEGIAPLVYKGLRSDAALDKSLHILGHLVALPDSDLVGTRSRLLFGILANLPRFLHSFDDPGKRNECFQSAHVLATVAGESQENQQLSIVLNAFANHKFTESVELLHQTLSAVRRVFFPTWELKALIFLIGLLTNRLHWYKSRSLEVLQAVIKDVDTRRPEIACHGPDLISPLLRLLQTEFCPQALGVMDHIMEMSETPMSKHHVRMSMVGSGSRSIRKEYEKTQSLYGIPEESGWSIPMPAIHSNTTRENMQAVYFACLKSGSKEATEAVPTPEIEFRADDDHNGSYFPLERSDTFASESRTEPAVEGGMGDLLTKLNSLDNFFDDSLDTDNDMSDRYSTITITPYTSENESGADIYDRQTAPILNKSLTRTDSVSSLHNGFGDLRLPPSNKDLGIMTPTAFNPPTSVPSTFAPPTVRPTLHSRSVTSPSNNLAGKVSNNVNDLVSDDEVDATFSEDERSTGYGGSRVQNGTSLRSTQSSMRTIAPGLEGKDYKQRGLLRAQSRGQSQAPGSPRVPKVPEAYLQQQGLKPSDTF